MTSQLYGVRVQACAHKLAGVGGSRTTNLNEQLLMMILLIVLAALLFKGKKTSNVNKGGDG